MKKTLFITAFSLSAILATAQVGATQASPSNLNAPPNAQPVPNSTTTEKSAATEKPLIPPAANPIPPVYPGGEARVVETQRNLIYPASPPAPTQPIQREPLTPIESTNTLQPTRPLRDEPSRSNAAVDINQDIKTVRPDSRAITAPVTTSAGTTTNAGAANQGTVITTTTTTTGTATTSGGTTQAVSSKEQIAIQSDGNSGTRQSTKNKTTVYNSGTTTPSSRKTTKTVRRTTTP